MTARPARLIHAPTPASARAPVRAGFTLAALGVTIALLGALAVVGRARFNYDQDQVIASARTVASLLDEAERRALSRQHDVRIAFDTAGRRLRVHDDANGDGVINPGEQVRYVALAEGIEFGRGNAAAAPFGGAAVCFTLSDGPLPVLVFRRDGSASETGGFYLTTHRNSPAGGSHDARAVEIVRATGRAFWYSYDGASWRRET